MGTVLAQAGVREVCGPVEEAEWLCEVVFEVTGNTGLAQAAGFGATAVWAVVIILVALVATRLSRRAVLRYTDRLEVRTTRRLERDHERGAITDTQRFRTRRLQRLNATSGVVHGVIGVVIWLTTLLLILELFGVPLQPLLAGAGLASVIIGFGAQQLVRDVLAGIAMLIEDQYGVGDWIEVDGVFGEVERVGLRSTAYRDVDGVLHHVLNGYMQRVGNLSQRWARTTLDVPVALDTDVAAAKALIARVATELATDPLWGQDVIGPPEVWGVQSFGPEGVHIRVAIPTKPLRNWDLARQLRERLKVAFDAAGIRMPGQLVDLGGQGGGHPVATRGVGTTSEGGVQHRHRDPQRPGTGEQAGAQPGRPGTDAAANDPDDTAEVVAEPAEDEGDDRATRPSDATMELRLRQGPRARPD